MSVRAVTASAKTALRDVAILGGGLSGLSAAWFLRRAAGDALRITVVEQTRRSGGWIHTERSPNKGFLFERGPRGFRPSGNGVEVLRLVDDLHLHDQVIGTNPASSGRWLWFDGKLQSVPNGLWQLLSTRFGLRLIYAVLREPFQRRRDKDVTDESIHSFVSRRFGFFVADKVIDAVVGGIFAGDTLHLSVKSCFRRLWDLETQYGSVVKGMLQEAMDAYWASLFVRQSDSSCLPPETPAEDLRPQLSNVCVALQKCLQVSFRGGMSTLTDTLALKLTEHPNTDILFNCDIQKISKQCIEGSNKETMTLKLKPGAFVSITAADRVSYQQKTGSDELENVREISCSHVLSTISCQNLSQLLTQDTTSDDDGSALISETTQLCGISSTLRQVAKATNMAVVNLAYNKAVLNDKVGFGHLVPSCELEQGVGVVWDSCVFPQQHRLGSCPNHETRLTVMMGGEHAHMRHLVKRRRSTGEYDEEVLQQTAVELVDRHLGIDETPTEIRAGVAEECIPQYTLGHEERVKLVEQQLQKYFGDRLIAIGMSFYGAGVSDNVAHARNAAEKIAQQLIESDIR